MTKHLMRRRVRVPDSIDRVDLWFGYVYVVRAGELYKIGSSKTPRQRFKTFRTGSAIPIELVWTLKTPHYKQVEKILHDRLAEKRIHGEWFALTDSDLAYIKMIDNSGRSPRGHAYQNAYDDAFHAAQADGISREDAQALGRIAGIEADSRASLLGCLCEW